MGVLTDTALGLENYPNNDDNKCPKFKYCPKGTGSGAGVKFGFETACTQKYPAGHVSQFVAVVVALL